MDVCAVMDMAQYSGRFLTDPAVHICPEILQFMIHPSLHASIKSLALDHLCCVQTRDDPDSVDPLPALDVCDPVISAVPTEIATSLTLLPSAYLAWTYAYPAEEGCIVRLVTAPALVGVSSPAVEWLECKRQLGSVGPLRVYYSFREVWCNIDVDGLAHVMLYDATRLMWVRLDADAASCHCGSDGGQLDEPPSTSPGWVHFHTGAVWVNRD